MLEWRLVCVSIARFMLAISISPKDPALGQLKTLATQGRARSGASGLARARPATRQ
jgi:hypothetical protein